MKLLEKMVEDFVNKSPTIGKIVDVIEKFALELHHLSISIQDLNASNIALLKLAEEHNNAIIELHAKQRAIASALKSSLSNSLPDIDAKDKTFKPN